jgi:hypothetical protein
MFTNAHCVMDGGIVLKLQNRANGSFSVIVRAAEASGGGLRSSLFPKDVILIAHFEREI